MMYLHFVCIVHCVMVSIVTQHLYTKGVSRILDCRYSNALYCMFCFTQESTKRLTMKKLPIVVCFHFKVIVREDNLGFDNFYNAKKSFYAIDCSHPLYLRMQEKKGVKLALSTQGWGGVCEQSQVSHVFCL